MPGSAGEISTEAKSCLGAKLPEVEWQKGRRVGEMMLMRLWRALGLWMAAQQLPRNSCASVKHWVCRSDTVLLVLLTSTSRSDGPQSQIGGLRGQGCVTKENVLKENVPGPRDRSRTAPEHHHTSRCTVSWPVLLLRKTCWP